MATADAIIIGNKLVTVVGKAAGVAYEMGTDARVYTGLALEI
jgi:hypothetical protein